MSYTTVDNAFWTDADVVDNFTPEDKYFYLYLLTNVHINASGCFEVSLKQIAQEMGYSVDTVEHLIDRFIGTHKVIDYDKSTKEILVHRWAKYHWTTSDKYLINLKKQIDSVKSDKFSLYLNRLMSQFIDSGGTVLIPYQYGMDTTVTVTVTVIDTDTDNIKDKSIDKYDEEKKEKKEKKPELSSDTETEAGGEMLRDEDKIEADELPAGDEISADGEALSCENEKIEVIDSALAGCSPDLIQAVDSWLAYKKEKRQTYKEKGKNALMKKIANSVREFGEEEVINAIEQSMANEYMGIVWNYMRKQNYGDNRKNRSAKTFGDMMQEALRAGS